MIRALLKCLNMLYISHTHSYEIQTQHSISLHSASIRSMELRNKNDHLWGWVERSTAGSAAGLQFQMSPLRHHLITDGIIESPI